MATGSELKKISESRIGSAKILLDRDDWHMASYLMGCALECALKSVICKTLKITDYPEEHKDKTIPSFFMTHFIDRLLLVSGLMDIFGSAAADPRVLNNWSQFTIRYLGDWVTMTYAEEAKQFDETTAKMLYQYLYDDEKSIIKTIDKELRW